ncbi:uncharacterized protein [Anas acuta]|uniref:uncharacterized protein isoform X1 n=1 Tax=Anas acuta TaxID=28680 RepID=UPI0035C8C493
MQAGCCGEAGTLPGRRPCHEGPRARLRPPVDSHPHAIPPLPPRGPGDRSAAVLCDMRVLAAGGEAPGGCGVRERVAGTKFCHPGLHPPGAEDELVPPRRRWGLRAVSCGVDAAQEEVFLGHQQEQLLEGEPGELQPSESPAAGARGPGRAGLPKSGHTETHTLLLDRPLPALCGDGLDLAGWLPPGPEPVQPEHPERQRSLRGAEGGQDHLGNLRLRLGVDLPERGRPALSDLGKNIKKNKKK